MNYASVHLENFHAHPALTKFPIARFILIMPIEFSQYIDHYNLSNKILYSVTENIMFCY